MRRREFIALASGTAVAWPLAARGQQATKLPAIGFLGGATASVWGPWVTALVQRLRELGWAEGRTVTIEYRWAEGSGERAYEIAVEFVRLKVDVIVTSGGVLAAAKRATTTVPIVFAVANDPVGSGFVENLARPGGNITGLSLQSTDLATKRVDLLRELVPGIRRLAILVNLGNPGAVLERDEVEKAARALGLDVAAIEVRQAEDFVPAFAAVGRVDALYVGPDALIVANRVRLNVLTLTARLPTVYASREFVDAGGLMSYGPSFPDLFRRAGDYVDKILRGAKPADLPIEQPTKFALVINLTTAKALGLNFSEAFLLRADEVIE